MKKIALSILTLCFYSFSASASGFKLNYKNINTLASLICGQVAPTQNSHEVVVSKININKTKLSQNNNDLKVEVSGTCNAIIDKKTKEIVSFGSDLVLEIKSTNKISIQGQVGLDKLLVSFKQKRIKNLVIINPYTDQQKVTSLRTVRWSKKDSPFTFNKKDLIKVRIGGRVLASEESSNLNILDGTKYYNIWRYSIAGCKSSTTLNQSQCEQFAELI